MISIWKHQFSLMVLYAVALHYIWMAGLLLDPDAVHATALFVFTSVLQLPTWVLPGLFGLVASLALIALTSPTIDRLSILLMLPQQFTLMISAYGTLHAVWLGQFGDGVIRTHGFILVDQPSYLAAVMHTLAIIGMGQRWKR